MKAVLIQKYGPADVLEIKDIDQSLPQDNEVIVRVYFSSVNPVDWKIRSGLMKFITGSKFPIRLGFDVAGEVVQTGHNITKFKKGDRVYGMFDFKNMGAYAEYVSMNENVIALIPEGIGFKEAAGIPVAGLTAYQALHYKGKIKTGDKVLINGASGGVGSFAVQIAKAAGAVVTGVCSTGNIELVKKLGADKIIDYKKEDFTKSSVQYDIIFDAVGKLTFFGISNNLTKSGRYVTTLPGPSVILTSLLLRFLSLFGYHKACDFLMVEPGSADLEKMNILIKAKKVIPLIDRVFTLEQIRDAHIYSETDRAKGKIIIKIYS